MVLAFIGSLFIIGKLSGSATDVNFGQESIKAGISSSSPGLILAFFGTTLMCIALLVKEPIDINDKPIYFLTTGLNFQNSAQGPDQNPDQDPPKHTVGPQNRPPPLPSLGSASEAPEKKPVR